MYDLPDNVDNWSVLVSAPPNSAYKDSVCNIYVYLFPPSFDLSVVYTMGVHNFEGI